MEFVILDLEWNNSHLNEDNSNNFHGRKTINEIIEFGAVKFDDQMNITDEFSKLVRQNVGKFISGRTKRLTHISTKILRSEGEPFKTVLSEFKKFLGNSVLMTWSTSDIIVLMENHEYYYHNNVLDFIKGFVNVQKYCQNMLGCDDPSKQIGLSKAAEMLGICQEGLEHHRALSDSMLTFECFKKLYNKEKLVSFIENSSNADFYERLAFKPTFLSDIDNPALDKSELYADCPVCGAPANQLGQWIAKNKSFRSDYECGHCGEKFNARIQFKVTYDGIKIKRGTAHITEEDNRSGNDINNENDNNFNEEEKG